jgi:hypothetical protein
MNSDTTPPMPPQAQTAQTPSPTETVDPVDSPTQDKDLEEWRWLQEGRRNSLFDQYAGQHIAVVNQQTEASDPSLRRLRQVLAEQHHLDPDSVVTAYIDPY